ncbi:MAG: hypothetical protein ACRDT0_25000 [Pseudonocardiaceae bacterium]
MQDDRQTLRTWLKELTLDPLDPSEPTERRYVELREAGRGAADEIKAIIDLRLDTTTQLLSGPSGSGKTTELHRVKGELQQAGFVVGMINATDYVNASSPIDVADFLVALALGANEQIGQSEPDGAQGFATRFGQFLRRINVTLQAGPVSVDVSEERVAAGAAGFGVGLNLKREIRGSPSFVAELREKLAFHVASLHEEVSNFLQQLVTGALHSNPGSPGVVLIVDSLEKLQGTSANDLDVQASVEALFVNHSDKLRFASHHTVYTVPTYLQFTAAGALPYDGRVLPVPVPHLRNQAGLIDQHSKRTLDELKEVVSRRVPPDQLFGGDQQLERIISASGGHLRDLFRLLQESVTLIYRRSLRPPLHHEHIDEVISNVALGFSSPIREQADFLRKIAKGDGTIEPARSEVPLMARLLQTHMLLAHLNGGNWYEVHPLARRALGIP